MKNSPLSYHEIGEFNTSYSNENINYYRNPTVNAIPGGRSHIYHEAMSNNTHVDDGSYFTKNPNALGALHPVEINSNINESLVYPEIHASSVFQHESEVFASPAHMGSSLNPTPTSLTGSPSGAPVTNPNIPLQYYSYIPQDVSIFSLNRGSNMITDREYSNNNNTNNQHQLTTIISDDEHTNHTYPPLQYQQLITQLHSNVSAHNIQNHHPQLSHSSVASYGSSKSDGSPFSHVRTTSSETVETKLEEEANQPLIKTAFWDDENTVCYQVEVDGVLVSRREDNNYINGTKLLNVAGLSRGKRDGMLKLERHKSIVKVGSMNLKGVWLPYARACEIARNLGIKNKLYPLLRDDLSEYFKQEGVHLKRDDIIVFGEENKV